MESRTCKSFDFGLFESLQTLKYTLEFGGGGRIQTCSEFWSEKSPWKGLMSSLLSLMVEIWIELNRADFYSWRKAACWASRIALSRGGLEDRLQKSHRTTDMSSICDIQYYHIWKNTWSLPCPVIFSFGLGWDSAKGYKTCLESATPESCGSI